MFERVKNTAFRYVFKALIKIKPPPTPIVFNDEKATEQLCQKIAKDGIQRLLVITSQDLVKLGLLDTALSALKHLGVQVVVFDGILPNPTFAAVEAATQQYKSNGCNGILAFGGGSVIDAAKAVTLHVGNKKDLNALVGIFKAKHDPAPFYVIPTTAGTGSEITSSAVISDTESHQKAFITDHKTIPLAVALDASVMTGLPPFITADTGMDALTHSIEAFVSKIDNPPMMTLAVNAVRDILGYLPEAYANGSNLEARSKMAKASYNAGMAFNHMGLGFVHAISHQLTALYGIPHGRANAVVLPYVLHASLPHIMPAIAALSRATGVSNQADDAQAAEQFLTRINTMSEVLGIPKTLDELKPVDFELIATRAREEATMTYPVSYMLSHKECVDILSDLASKA